MKSRNTNCYLCLNLKHTTWLQNFPVSGLMPIIEVPVKTNSGFHGSRANVITIVHLVVISKGPVYINSSISHRRTFLAFYDVTYYFNLLVIFFLNSTKISAPLLIALLILLTILGWRLHLPKIRNTLVHQKKTILLTIGVLEL